MIEFQLSSSKRGYGLKELLLEDLKEYWSSDAVLPHRITILFNKKEFIYSIELYLSFSKDESYTPENVNWYFNGVERSVNLTEPEGWTAFMICDKTAKIDLVITGNHTDGKDSHVRNLRIKKSPEEIFYF
ncbi:hypothetical protein EHP00_2664 [Ecytonucleospora hepatopenaei]|uniref:Anapc10 n=1 Tax=Ecytonucleospora hepatopenaei TaxID=646526 RepID=A0A1W0E2N9_9MICR|nr:Anapc10 [Ecytonucleospora hepatopenaei]OQS53500.1 hypothetical protein EHP00_2664 [Ecytonucleospora hepatopenaei]